MDVSKVQANLEQVLTILRNVRTDDQRMAALLVVTKSLNPRDLSREDRQRLFDAIGSKFICRLLRTEKVPEGCSPNVFKSLAVAILSCLATDDATVLNPVIVTNLEALNKIIVSVFSSSTDEDDAKMIKDCYAILNFVASSHEGREQLNVQNTLGALCRSVANDCYCSSSALGLVHFLCLSSEGEEGIWRSHRDDFRLLLQRLPSILKTDMGAMKFHACDLLLDMTNDRTLWTDVETGSVVGGRLPSETRRFYDDIWAGLFSILRSRIGAKQRESALKLASVVVGNRFADVREDEFEDDEFLPLLLRLCCIEVRMMLEDPNAEMICAVKIDVLVACYSILEATIVRLPQRRSSDDDDDDDSVRLLRSPVDEVFSAVVYFLKTLSEPEKLKSIAIFQPCILSSLRLIGSYIGDGSFVKRDDFVGVLLLILNICILAFVRKELLCVGCRRKTDVVLFGRNFEVNDATGDDRRGKQGGGGGDSTSDRQSSGKIPATNAINGADASHRLGSSSVKHDSALAKSFDEMAMTGTSERKDDGGRFPAGLAANAAWKSGGNVERTEDKTQPSSEALPCGNDGGRKRRRQLPCWFSAVFRFFSVDRGDPTRCTCEKRISSRSDRDDDVENLEDVSEDDDCGVSETLETDAALRDLVYFVLPGLASVCDRDETRRVVYETNFHHLVVIYFERWCTMEDDAENEIIFSDLAESLLALLSHQDFVFDDAFKRLFDFLIDRLPFFVARFNKDDDKSFGLSLAYIVALGMKLLRRITWSCSKNEKVSSFVEFCCSFLSGIFETNRTENGKTGFGMKKCYDEKVYPLYVITTTDVAEIVKLHPDLAPVFIKSRWLSEIVKLLEQVKGGGFDAEKELFECFQHLVSEMAKTKHGSEETPLNGNDPSN